MTRGIENKDQQMIDRDSELYIYSSTLRIRLRRHGAVMGAAPLLAHSLPFLPVEFLVAAVTPEPCTECTPRSKHTAVCEIEQADQQVMLPSDVHESVATANETCRSNGHMKRPQRGERESENQHVNILMS